MSVIVGSARCLRRARRAEAGAPAHPVLDERAGSLGRPVLCEVGARRRRRDGQVSPARRHGDLRQPRADGPAILDGRAADRRPGQLRLHRQRSAGPDALHRVPPDQGRRLRSADGRHELSTPSISATTTSGKEREPMGAGRRGSPTCWSTARAASPGWRQGWPPASRRTTWARWSTPGLAARIDRRSRLITASKRWKPRSCRGRTFRPTARSSAAAARARRC